MTAAHRLRRPSVAVVAFAALWLTAIMSRFGYETHALRLRLSEAIAVVVILVAVVILRKPLAWPAMLLPLAFVAVETLSTALNPVDWSRGFKLDLLLAVEALIAIGAAYLARLIEARTLARALVAAGVIEAVLAIVLSALYVLHVTGFGVQVDPATLLCKAYGTMYEANLLASYLGAVLVFLFAARRLIGPPWMQAAAAATIAVAIGLTLTRAAWLAIMAGLVTLLILRARYRTPTRVGEVVSVIVLIGLLAGAAGVILIAANRGVCGHETSLATQGSSVTGRFINQGIALNEWKESPVIGLGTGSIKGKQVGDPNLPWISSFALGVLHDTGIFGAIIVVVLLALLFRGLLRRDPTAPDRQLVVDGLTAAIVMLLVAFQATTGELMEFPWLFVGSALGVMSPRDRT